MSGFSQGINNVSNVVQWPLMGIPLRNVTEWRNEQPNLQRRIVSTAAYIGIALATVVGAVAKCALGIIVLIPPFTHSGATILFSVLVFESQVFFNSLASAKRGLFQQRISPFKLRLI